MNAPASRESSERISLHELPSLNVDAIMATELNKLSVRDRTNIQEEIHGVHSLALEETPSLISSSLLALLEEIDKFKDEPRRQAFDEAMRMEMSLVHQKYFLLQFLRADLFDAKKACWRMMTHVRLLKKYFGLVALERQLGFSDLPKVEQTLIRKGYIQILPSRDRAGRLVVIDNDSIHTSDDSTEAVPNMIRMMLYIVTVMAEDLDTQRRGLVSISTPSAKYWSRFLNSTAEQQRDYAEYLQSIPIRLGALHLCLPEGPTSKFLRALVSLGLLREEGRMRIRVHNNIFSLETQYELLSFGLPVHEIPLSITGSIKTRNHLRWIKMRTALERLRTTDSKYHDKSMYVIYPGLCDVLLSKGGNRNHYGNMEFRHVLDIICPIYNSTTDRNERRQLRQQIVDFVTKEKKGRFLQVDPRNGWWVIISDPTLLMEKVGTALYLHNRKLLAKAAPQVTSSVSDEFSYHLKRRNLCSSTFCRSEERWENRSKNV